MEGLGLEVQTPAGLGHVEVVDRFRNVPQLTEARAKGRRLAMRDEIYAGVEVLIHPPTIDEPAIHRAGDLRWNEDIGESLAF